MVPHGHGPIHIGEGQAVALVRRSALANNTAGLAEMLAQIQQLGDPPCSMSF